MQCDSFFLPPCLSPLAKITAKHSFRPSYALEKAMVSSHSHIGLFGPSLDGATCRSSKNQFPSPQTCHRGVLSLRHTDYINFLALVMQLWWRTCSWYCSSLLYEHPNTRRRVVSSSDHQLFSPSPRTWLQIHFVLYHWIFTKKKTGQRLQR